jgi:hypothetical protein
MKKGILEGEKKTELKSSSSPSEWKENDEQRKK